CAKGDYCSAIHCYQHGLDSW
nr:immunoglobulin heavy chain junction region [Macaca mulatta]